MLDKESHIKYWITMSSDDWESAQIMFNSGKYSHALFLAHLTIEKLCKALLIKSTEEIYPPKIHDLVKLLKRAAIALPENDLAFLKALNFYNLEGRYPDYISMIYKTTTKDKTIEILDKTERIRKCLLEKLQ